MSKAYDYGAREIWVLNVGDIKPGEIGIDQFLDMAWDMKKYQSFDQKSWLRDWAARTFDARLAPQIAEVLDGYFRLNSVVKPEHIRLEDVAFSLDDYGDEAQRRLDDWAALTRKVNAILPYIAPARRDAFTQLVAYPVRGADLMNQKQIYAYRSRMQAAQGRVRANVDAAKALAAYRAIQAETDYYNTQMAGGKWNHMMSGNPRGQKVFKRPETGVVTPLNGAVMGVRAEGTPPEGDNTQTLPAFNSLLPRARFVDIYNKGDAPIAWKAVADAPWITLGQTAGQGDGRLLVSIDWSRAPQTEQVSGLVRVSDGVTNVPIELNATRMTVAPNFNGFVENNGFISMEAEDFTRARAVGGAHWQVINGLGRNSDAVAVFPTTTPSINADKPDWTRAPHLEYDLQTLSAGKADITVTCRPTHAITPLRGLRYAIAIGDETPQIVGVDAKEYSRAWMFNINRAAAQGQTKHRLGQGTQTLKIWMVDPGVVIDKIVVSRGELPPSFVGPPPTKIPIR